VHHKFIEDLDPSAIVIEQGYEMGRPSTLQVSVGKPGSEIDSIQVGGQAITVLEGNLRI
jgi:predicted PhzF superfamily epimerase YddE/YHI9